MTQALWDGTLLMGISVALGAGCMVRVPGYRKVGGLHFLRVGRFQVSFCRCKSRI